MTEPLELQGIDASGADPALRDAPLVVRKADVWLQRHREKPARKWASIAAALLPFAGMFAGAAVASMAGSEPVGAAVMLSSWAVAGGALVAIHRAWGRTAGWATGVMKRYRDLEEIGLSPSAAAGDLGEAAPAIERLATRIEALAGDRPDLVESVRAARDHALRLQAELKHIDEVATGDPEADVALDAARERLLAEVSATRARVAEAYAALLELQAGATDDVSGELEASLQRLGAEVEVDQAARRARARRERAK